MDWTNHSFRDLGAGRASLESLIRVLPAGNSTTLKPEMSIGIAATALSGSIGGMALVLLLVGVSIVILKKWRRERQFKKQLRLQTNFLHKSLDFPCQAEPVYCNVISLAPWKEDDFAIYANVPRFGCPRRTMPDQVEYASIVFR